MTPRPRILLATLALASLTAGCGSSPSSGPATSSTTSAGASGSAKQKVTVFAAASLQAVFKEIAAAHPELEVTFSFDGSQVLVDQLKGGASADVLATADTATMDKAVAAGVIDGSPTPFATNGLVLIVPAGNAAKITGINDSLTGRKLVVCAPAVPCGAATGKLAGLLGITLKPVSEESKVTDVRGKVESGEADAGIVYSTDAKASGAKVETIAIPGADKVINTYPIALVAKGAHGDAAKAFTAAVTSAAGKASLAKAGFGTP